MRNSAEQYEEKLALLRAGIDAIDLQTGPIFGAYFSPSTIEEYRLTCEKLTSLFAARTILTAEVGGLKARHSVEPVQEGRYLEVAKTYENNRKQYFPHVNAVQFAGVVELIHSASVRQQYRIRDLNPSSGLSDVA
jgi:chorismate mutase